MADSENGAPEPQERYNALIKPTDDDWIAVHDKFKDLLAKPTLRTEQILKTYFTVHERKLFMSATEPRSLRDCQEHNTRRYRTLIAGRFKDCHLSLATKFTMLYFGLPVEPILSELLQCARPDFDVEDWDELYDIEVRPPLHFLTAHDQRNYGRDHMRGTEAHFSTIPVPASQMPESTGARGLSLRGGAYNGDDLEMEDVESLPNIHVSQNSRQRHQHATVEELDDFDYEKDDVDGDITITGVGNSTRTAQAVGLDVGHPAPSFTRRLSGPKTNFTLPPISNTSGNVASRPKTNVKFDEQSTEAPQLDDWVPLHGYQGRIMFNPNDLSTFQEAARKLLSLRRRDGCDIMLVEFDRRSKGVTKSFRDKIPHNPAGALANRLKHKAKSDPNCAWFILRGGESHPTEWEPQEADFSTKLIKLSHMSSEGHENISYCNVPSRKLYFGIKTPGNRVSSPKPWGANQYMPFLTTAQQVLVGTPDRPGASHYDLVISEDDGRARACSSRCYGGIEIHRGLWDAMHPYFTKGKPSKVEARPLPKDSIVFYLPGGVNDSLTLRNRECLRQKGSEDPYPDALRKVEAMIRGLIMPPNMSSFRIWRGTDYFNPLVSSPTGDHEPVLWKPQDHEAPNQNQDQEALSKFIVNAVDDRIDPCRVFVIQPLDGIKNSCYIETPRRNGSAEFQVEPDTMETLKSKVRNLYKRDPEVQYDPQHHSILIEPIFEDGESGQWNPARFVLRPDAADYELVMVRRLLVTQSMRVSVCKGDELDFVKNVAKELDGKNQWGPRYGQVTPFRAELSLPTIAQPTENHSMASRKQSEEAIRGKPKVPKQHPRESSWWVQPSVYDSGIYHPSFPINAPPVEPVMRTGGSRVPIVTKNVLTTTEQRETQNALWKTRSMVLDRLGSCPYQRCNFTHRVDEDDRLVRHLEEAHSGQKCPWCGTQFFPFWSRKQKEEHYRSSHADQLRKILEQPGKPAPCCQTSQITASGGPRNATAPLTPPPSSFKIMERTRLPVGPLPRPVPPPKASEKETDYRYCDRCGRDHTVLSGRADRGHHDRVCVPLAEGAGLCTFCEACGDREWKTEQDAKEFAPFDEYPHKCRGTIHRDKPHCKKCGLPMKKMTDEAIDRHRTYCAGYYGTVGCFCPYCQRHFVKDKTQKPMEDIKKHISECDDRGPKKTTPYEIYPETYWKDKDVPVDPLYVGHAASTTLVRKQRRPNGPTRYLSLPLMWYEKSGPTPVQDPPSECTIPGCREPLFGLTSCEVLAHFETNHGGQPQKQCPLCHLPFRRPKDERKKNPELGEWEDRKDQVSHMECHVYQLWDILVTKGAPPSTVNREPFYAGHSLWDPSNERALDRRDKRCPHFDKCGTMVGFMNQQQWNRHMETAHAAEDFETRVPRDRAADIQTAFEDRRRQRIREGKQPMAGQVRPVSNPKETEQRRTGVPGRKSVTLGPAFPPPEQSGARGTQPGGKVPEAVRSRGVGSEGAHPRTQPETPVAGHTRQKGFGTVAKARNAGEKPTKPVEKTDKPRKPTGGQTGKHLSRPALGQKSSSGTKPSTGSSAATVQSYDAADDMYCSRCFRKAPKRGSRVQIPDGDPSRQEQIDAHSDPKRSCRIRPQEGRVKFNRDGEPILPSRVGWIRKGPFKFTEMKEAFVKNNPDLERTMCPTDARWTRAYSKWMHDPNNDSNNDVWGLPYRPKKGQNGEDSEEDDGEDDYVEGDEGEDDEDEEMGEGEVEEGDENNGSDGAEGNSGIRRQRKRKLFRGVQPHDPTYRDRGDEDDLSEEDPSELVPESGGEGSGNTWSRGGKRKRDTADSPGQTQAGTKNQKSQERERKKARVSEGAQDSKS